MESAGPPAADGSRKRPHPEEPPTTWTDPQEEEGEDAETRKGKAPKGKEAREAKERRAARREKERAKAFVSISIKALAPRRTADINTGAASVVR